MQNWKSLNLCPFHIDLIYSDINIQSYVTVQAFNFITGKERQTWFPLKRFSSGKRKIDLVLSESKNTLYYRLFCSLITWCYFLSYNLSKINNIQYKINFPYVVKVLWLSLDTQAMVFTPVVKHKLQFLIKASGYLSERSVQRENHRVCWMWACRHRMEGVNSLKHVFSIPAKVYLQIINQK